MSKKEKNLGYAPIRRGIRDHLRTGKMKGSDFGLYVALHLDADYRCGVVYHRSAPYYAQLLKEKLWTIKRAMKRLEDSGYIKRFGHHGRVSGYDLLLDRYLFLKCAFIVADKSNSLQEIAWTVTEDCTLLVRQVSLNCTLSALQVSRIEEVIEIKEIIEEGKPRSFYPPTLEEITKYIQDKNLSVEPSKFLNYYSLRGWKKQNGKRVVNWKNTMLEVWAKQKGVSNAKTGRDSFAEQRTAIGQKYDE